MVDKSDNLLLIQNPFSITGSFQADADVKAVANAEGLIFTLTAGLAAELSDYECVNHADMTGNITTN